MKRYYLCPSVKNARGAWFPKIVNIVTPNAVLGEKLCWVAPLQDLNTGAMLSNYFFVLADLLDHTAVLADSTILPVPDAALDTQWSAVTKATRDAFEAALTGFGFTQADVVALKQAGAVRDVVRACGRKLQDVFDENKFETLLGGF